MQTDKILIAQPDTNEQLSNLKKLVKSLKIKFEIKEKPYNPEFVAKILRSEEEIRQGKCEIMTTEELRKFLDV